MPWIWTTLAPKSGSSTAWILTASGSLTPASPSAVRTSSTDVGSASAALIRVPDSKSMPKLRPRVENAIAPTSRIAPDIEKNQRLAPAKSKCQRTRSSPAPTSFGF